MRGITLAILDQISMELPALAAIISEGIWGYDSAPSL